MFDKDFIREQLTKVALRVVDGAIFGTGVRLGNAACDSVAKFLGFSKPETSDKKKS